MSDATSEERELFAVVLNDAIVGALETDSQRVEFFFSQQYLDSADRPVLGLNFEDDLRRRHISSVSIPPWFANLLPEGTLRNWIAEDRGVNHVREMELLAHVGHDLPGAVQIIPTNAVEFSRAAVRSELENEIVEPDLAEDPWRFSLAGVALKMSMLRKGQGLTIPSRGALGDTIVKFPDRVFPNVPLNEWSMMRLAERVGIDVPQVHLVHRDETQTPDNVWPETENVAYAVDRFDRVPSGDRVHIEDFAQVLGKRPLRKYDCTIETLGALVYRSYDEESLNEYVRRQTLNILISNGDAHLKNWSLIYRDARRPSLSPAYDIVSTALYRPSGNPERLAMKVAGSKRFERARLRHFERLGVTLRASHLNLAEVADETISKVLEQKDAIRADLSAIPAMAESVIGSCVARARTLRSRADS